MSPISRSTSHSNKQSSPLGSNNQTSHQTSITRNSDMNNHAIDSLTEQVNSVLSRLATSSTAAQQLQQRTRRFSDTDRASTSTPSTGTQSLTVRSRDGSRLVPAPAEQTQIVGSRNTSSSETEPAATATPLEQHKCDAAICAAAKVFETTELLESVLSFLDTKCILELRRTSSHWAATIQQSPPLRLHFFYYPQFTRPTDEFQLLPLSLPGLSIELGEPLHLGRWIHVSMTKEAARKIAPDPKVSRRPRSRSIFEGLRGGLGPRAGPSTDPWPAARSTPSTSGTFQVEDLFVTQPPVVGMQAFLTASPSATSSASAKDSWDGESSEDEVNYPAPCAKLSCDAGITLGFLAETAQSLLPSSPQAGGGEAKVVFKAIVSFCKGEAAPRKRGTNRSVTRIG